MLCQNDKINLMTVAHKYRLELNKWDSTNLVPRSPTAKGKTE